MPHHDKNRCPWCDGQPDYKIYHDTEWGVPIYDDDKLFETLLLETFQAGLNWFTVLRKREIFARLSTTLMRKRSHAMTRRE